MKPQSKVRLLVLTILAVLRALVAIPNFARARRTTSMNGCWLNLMWIETAKAQWARDQRKASKTTPTQDELMPYLAKVAPMWDGRRVRPARLQAHFPTCTLTNAPYLLGTVGTRTRCQTQSWAPELHAWDEAEYRYHYNLK
jgi:hypothetical protein